MVVDFVIIHMHPSPMLMTFRISERRRRRSSTGVLERRAR